jgi:type I site-specific restriction endonuclease
VSNIPSVYFFARAELHAKNLISILKSQNPDKEAMIAEGLRYMEFVHKAMRARQEEEDERDSNLALTSSML